MIWALDDWDAMIRRIFADVWVSMAIAYVWPRHILTRWTTAPRARTLPLPRSWLGGRESDPLCSCCAAPTSTPHLHAETRRADAMTTTLTAIRPPANLRGLRTWPTNDLVQVRPNADRPANVMDVILGGETIGKIEFYTRRVRSKVGRTNFVREHAQRKTWSPVSDELHNPSYDRRWEAVRDVIENHQKTQG